jgi:hypothetical protein
MTLGPIAFLSPWLLAGALALPGHLVAAAHRAAAAAPARVPADPHPGRHREPREDAGADALVADADPHAGGIRSSSWRWPSRCSTRTATRRSTGSGPVVLVVDNGWSSAAQWSARTFLIERLIAEAEGQSRPVLIVPTANATRSISLKIEAPNLARSTATALQPQPFAPDRIGAVEALAATLRDRNATVVWLADGIDHDGNTRRFAERLQELAGGGFSVVETRPGVEALATSAGIAAEGKLEAQVLRAEGGARAGVLHAVSARGQRLGETAFTLGDGDTRALATFDLPLELRNQVTRVEIAGERSAGAVNLLDARSQWHRVGILASTSREEAQPLLAPLYYIERRWRRSRRSPRARMPIWPPPSTV